MMPDIHAILKDVWGFDRFRPLQEDIIRSVLDGNDTLALLPTGGGKSICFQVPALALEGTCLVVSPLIALMKDQVENLLRHDIPAIAIYSGMSARQMDFELDNCAQGKYRFVYVSPERLKTELFRARLERMPVSMLAVDEAHCISQWGYDFRPEYLQIAEIRKWIKGPVLALTATATPEVVEDIQDKLEFRKKQVFRKSFERKNLSYLVLKEENKTERLLEICRRTPGTGVIYARNRKLCRDLAEYLRQNGVSADYYHAGLDQQTRSAKQDAWIQNRIRVIVSTNAFGMGIDKPDVRFVLHYELPDSLEAYYQEAGRAGRDEKSSYCVALFHPHDRETAFDKLAQSFPGYETVQQVYEGVMNSLNIAVHSGQFTEHPFDLVLQSQKLGMPAPQVFHALQILEKQEILRLSDAVHQPAAIHMLVDNTYLYDFEIRNPKVAPFIKLLLRTYGGLFDHYIRIDQGYLARQIGAKTAEVHTLLEKMKEAGILDYVPARNAPTLTLLQDRMQKLSYDQVAVKERKKAMEQRLEAVFRYASGGVDCRSQALLAYFGESGAPRCGSCDLCRADKKQDWGEDAYVEHIRELVKRDIRDLKTMSRHLGYWHEEGLQMALQHLLDEGRIHLNDKQEIEWTGN